MQKIPPDFFILSSVFWLLATQFKCLEGCITSDIAGIKSIRAFDWIRAALYGILKGTGNRDGDWGLEVPPRPWRERGGGEGEQGNAAPVARGCASGLFHGGYFSRSRVRAA
jgi:hypothetical protein